MDLPDGRNLLAENLAVGRESCFESGMHLPDLQCYIHMFYQDMLFLL